MLLSGQSAQELNNYSTHLLFVPTQSNRLNRRSKKKIFIRLTLTLTMAGKRFLVKEFIKHLPRIKGLISELPDLTTVLGLIALGTEAERSPLPLFVEKP